MIRAHLRRAVRPVAERAEDQQREHRRAGEGRGLRADAVRGGPEQRQPDHQQRDRVAEWHRAGDGLHPLRQGAHRKEQSRDDDHRVEDDGRKRLRKPGRGNDGGDEEPD